MWDLAALRCDSINGCFANLSGCKGAMNSEVQALYHHPHSVLGSFPTFVAFAHRKNWIAALNVRFLQIAQFSLRAQRKSGFRPLCQMFCATHWLEPL